MKSDQLVGKDKDKKQLPKNCTSNEPSRSFSHVAVLQYSASKGRPIIWVWRTRLGRGHAKHQSIKKTKLSHLT